MLCDSEIGTIGGIAIFEALMVNPTLSQIDMATNKIGSEAVPVLCKALKVNKALRGVICLHS